MLAPGFEELHCRSLIDVIPKSREAFLQSPCLAGFQIGVVEALERGFTAQVGEIAQPIEFAVLQGLVALFHQGPVLRLAQVVDGLVQVGADVELIMHDVSVGQHQVDGLLIGRPHVHRHRLDAEPLLAGQCI